MLNRTTVIITHSIDGASNMKKYRLLWENARKCCLQNFCCPRRLPSVSVFWETSSVVPLSLSWLGVPSGHTYETHTTARPQTARRTLSSIGPTWDRKE